MRFPVAILAGGLATRLRPLTDRIPKSLVSISGRPFIFHQLDLLLSQGVERVVLCVGHLGEQIEAVVGKGRCSGLTIQYSFDGDQPLGTGGALKQALPLLGDDFFVLYGDSYLPCSLEKIQLAYQTARRPALMTVVRNDSGSHKNNVCIRNGELLAYDKQSHGRDMSHIDYGMSVFSKDAIARHGEARVFDLADVCSQLCRNRQLAAFEVHQRFYEIGSLQGIQETELFLSRRAVEA
jgi:N-acetyl-alpha-D-muramate 1-phosphate uridylyltransferase